MSKNGQARADVVIVLTQTEMRVLTFESKKGVCPAHLDPSKALQASVKVPQYLCVQAQVNRLVLPHQTAVAGLESG